MTTVVERPGLAAEGAIESFFAAIADLPAGEAMVALERCRRRCDAVEAMLARHEGQAGRLLRGAGVSRFEAARRVGRAGLIDRCPELGNLLASGVISAAQVDLLVAADRKSEGAAADDTGLLADVVEAGPDGARRVVNEWLASRVTAVDAGEKHQRQRDARAASRYKRADGQAAVTLAGDDASIDQLWAAVEVEADRLYRADGGRETAMGAHPRTRDQRLFDAALAVLSATAGPSGKPAVVFTVDVHRLLQPDGEPLAELVGTGPVADDAIVEVLKHASLWTLLGEPNGRPLWLGRTKRSASTAQLIAMAIRDRGCVETGLRWSGCDAHHNTAWNGTGKGRTDIDQMVLVAPGVHRDLHADDDTFEWDDRIRKWRRRKATVDERAPARGDPP